jgi:imidazolonepropionase-like amidohydrolase
MTQTHVIAIKNIAVIDVTNGKVNKGQTIIIKGNKITSIKSKAVVPEGATLIEAGGKYLIPGLWDMHAHAFTDRKFEWLFPLLIANGITGVRDLATAISFDSIRLIKKQIAEGKLLGPRFGAVTQKIFNGIDLPGTPTMAVTSPEQARELVRNYKQQGMDFIKVYNQLSPEVFLAIVEEAKLQKIPFAGHVPYAMSAAWVSDLGQLSIEHNTDILVSCSSEETKLREELAALPQNLAPGAGPRQDVDIKAMQTFDEQKAISLFKRFIHNGTWLCPTLVVPIRSIKEVDELAKDDRLKYIPRRFRDQWYNVMKNRPVNPVSENGKLLLKKRIEIVGLMHRTGVNILSGSDFMNPYVYPGFSLLDELELFVQGGLSPLEALQTATLNPARFFKKEKEFGTVEKGRFADLVLLDENPLENISNIRKIYAVIANGRLFQRADLDSLLNNIQQLNK